MPKSKMNLRSSAVKRIMQEASELADPSEDDFIAAPLEVCPPSIPHSINRSPIISAKYILGQKLMPQNDIFEWHCTMRGIKDSEYEGGKLYPFTAFKDKGPG